MLSGNMSSTASALVNMTNSTITPSLLRVADSGDNGFSAGSGLRVGLVLILFVGFAIYLMRNNSPLRQVIMLDDAQNRNQLNSKNFFKKPAKEASEKTPLLVEEPWLNVRKNVELEMAITNLGSRHPETTREYNEYEGIEVDIEHLDLSTLELDEEGDECTASGYTPPSRATR
jgi:hypothetical protein